MVMLITTAAHTRFQSIWLAYATAAVFLLVTLTAHAGEESPTIDANAAKRQLSVASGLILAHQSGRAVTEILDPLIVQYLAAYGRSQDVIYSTSDRSQALLYLGQAARSHRSAKVIDSTWAEANYLKGFALIELGRISEAREALQRAIALSPANAGYWNELASSYQLEKSFVKAVELFRHAEMAANLQQDPKLKSDQLRRAWRGVAYALVELGRLDEAEAFYKRCLELEPRDAMAKNQLMLVAKLRSRGDGTALVSRVARTPQEAAAMASVSSPSPASGN
jgi:tetratricopeptide (TPR) repeat protein